MIVEGDMPSRESEGGYPSREDVCCLVFKMREMTLCVYADGNCSVERGTLMMQEKGTIWFSRGGGS